MTELEFSADIEGEFLSRGRGIFTSDEQEQLRRATVAIAGVGGVGGRVAETLARSGVGSLRLADPDHFTASNLNRQAASTVGNLGTPKVTAVGDLCESVSPFVATRRYADGVTPENVHEFVRGAQVVLDGTDYTSPSIGLRLARAAHGLDVPTVLGVEVGFSVWFSVLTREDAFERLLGLPRGVRPEDLESGNLSVSLWRWVARVPPYVSLQTLRALEQGDIEAPAIAPAVELSAALLSTEIIGLLLGRPPSVTAPRLRLIDARTGFSGRIHQSYPRFVYSAVRARLGDRAMLR